MDIVNERTTWIINASFTDENEDAVIPDLGEYSISDEKSGTEIVGPTAFDPSSSSYDFEVLPEQNRILNAKNRFEERILTLTFVYSGNKEGTAEYRWSVKNLDKIPMEDESS